MANIASLKQELTESKPRPSSPASVMRKTGITSRYGFLNLDEAPGPVRR